MSVDSNRITKDAASFFSDDAEESIASFQGNLRTLDPGAFNASFKPLDQVMKRNRQDFFEGLGANVHLFDVLPGGVRDIAAPWQMLLNQLSQFISGGATFKGIQLISTPTAASWDDSKVGLFRAIRILSDTLPGWGGTYRPTQRRVSDGYRVFLDNIAIPAQSATDLENLKKAKKKYNGALDAYEEAMLDSGQRWTRFNERQRLLPAERRLSFDDWFRRFEEPRVNTVRDERDLAAQEYQRLLNIAFRGAGFAANLATEFASEANEIKVLDENEQFVNLKAYTITPSLADFIAVSRAIPTGSAPRMRLVCDQNTLTTSASDTNWGGSASFFGGFFGFGAGASGGSSTFSTSSSHFHMEFSALNFRMFTIMPGRWFNGTAVQAFKDGPWVSGGLVDTGQVKLYGADGLFSLMPAQILVAFKPKVAVTLSNSEYTETRSRFNASGGFSIGPFGFGASYGRSQTDVHFDDATNTVTAEDTTDSPQIVAIISSVLPKFE